jgi:hypothetical protein
VVKPFVGETETREAFAKKGCSPIGNRLPPRPVSGHSAQSDDNAALPVDNGDGKPVEQGEQGTARPKNDALSKPAYIPEASSATERIDLLLHIRNTPEAGATVVGSGRIFKVKRFVLSHMAAHPGRLRVRE